VDSFPSCPGARRRLLFHLAAPANKKILSPFPFRPPDKFLNELLAFFFFLCLSSSSCNEVLPLDSQRKSRHVFFPFCPVPSNALRFSLELCSVVAQGGAFPLLVTTFSFTFFLCVCTPFPPPVKNVRPPLPFPSVTGKSACRPLFFVFRAQISGTLRQPAGSPLSFFSLPLSLERRARNFPFFGRVSFFGEIAQTHQ